MKDPIVLAKAGPFEVLADCYREPYNDYCEKIATRRSQGYYLCEPCATAAGLANLLWERAQYESCGRSSGQYSQYIHDAFERMGIEMATKIGRLDLYNQYIPNRG